MKNYYTELPEGYYQKWVIDAKDKKVALIFTLASTLLFVGVFLLIFFLKGFEIGNVFSGNETKDIIIAEVILIGGIIGYIILHELTHGLFYKIFTHEKLTFGLTLTVAFCGVPNLYCSKKTMLHAILAPLVIWTTILLPIIIILPANIYCFVTTIIFSLHFSGCIGDMIGTVYLLRCPANALIQDTGPTQTFYFYDENLINTDK